MSINIQTGTNRIDKHAYRGEEEEEKYCTKEKSSTASILCPSALQKLHHLRWSVYRRNPKTVWRKFLVEPSKCRRHLNRIISFLPHEHFSSSCRNTWECRSDPNSTILGATTLKEFLFDICGDFRSGRSHFPNCATCTARRKKCLRQFVLDSLKQWRRMCNGNGFSNEHTWAFGRFIARQIRSVQIVHRGNILFAFWNENETFWIDEETLRRTQTTLVQIVDPNQQWIIHFMLTNEKLNDSFDHRNKTRIVRSYIYIAF